MSCIENISSPLWSLQSWRLASVSTEKTPLWTALFETSKANSFVPHPCYTWQEYKNLHLHCSGSILTDLQPNPRKQQHLYLWYLITVLPAPSKVGGCSEVVEAVKVMDPCSLSRELLCAVVIVITIAQICLRYFMEPKLFLRWRATQMWSWGTRWWWWRPWLWRTCSLLLGSCSVPVESYSSVKSALLISRTSLYLIFTYVYHWIVNLFLKILWKTWKTWCITNY